jgi:hypothetical protein
VGVDAVVISYRNQEGRTASEVLVLADGVVTSGFATYGAIVDPVSSGT